VSKLEEEARIIHEMNRADNGTDPFSSAVRATRMPMLITDPRQDDNPIVFANVAFSKLTGFEHHEIVGRNCRFLQGPLTDRAEVARLRDAIERCKPIELELLNYRKDGSTFWNRLLVSPVFDDDGALTYFFASQFDVTLERERLVRLEQDRETLEEKVARREVELLVSAAKLSFALNAGRLGSWTLSLDTGVLEASDGCKENFGRPADQPFSYEDLQEAVHPDDRQMRDDAVAAAVRDSTPLDIEYRIKTPQGEERWVQVRGQANYRADGTPLTIVGVSQDVTERRRADEHRQLLANELSHRVKNSLAMMQAVVWQTMRTASTMEEARKTIDERIQAMAAANDLLVNDQWESTSIRPLIERTLAPFGFHDTGQFELTGSDVRLSPNTAVALALAIHELATNAVKYGALCTEAGIVRIKWEERDGWRPRQLHISWAEEGGPPVTPPAKTGFGTKLIKRGLAQESGAEVTLDFQSTGLIFTAVIPLAE
jgi:PAS domain S-box-containing protein